MPRHIRKVANFNPRFIVWFRTGSQQPTPVTFPERRFATRCRQDLYELRKAMSAERHFIYPFAAKCEITLRPVDPQHNSPTDLYTVTIRPAGYDINDALDAAGISEPELENSSPLPLDKNPSPSSDDLDYGKLMQTDK